MPRARAACGRCCAGSGPCSREGDRRDPAETPAERGWPGLRCSLIQQACSRTGGGRCALAGHPGPSGARLQRGTRLAGGSKAGSWHLLSLCQGRPDPGAGEKPRTSPARGLPWLGHAGVGRGGKPLPQTRAQRASSATLTFTQGLHDQPDGEGGATATARMESPLSPGEDQPGKHVPRRDTVAIPAWRAAALEASTPPRRVLVEHGPGWTAGDRALGTNTDQRRGHKGLARGGPAPSSPAQAPARGLQAFLSRSGAELVTPNGCRPHGAAGRAAPPARPPCPGSAAPG